MLGEYVARRTTALFDCMIVGGATAQGLVNPNSATDALRIFQGRLDGARPPQTIMMELGEVDCGFVIWYRAETHGISVAEQLETSLGNYLGFIDRQLAAGLSVTVLSVPPPTISDGQQWGEIANLRRAVTASQVERTALTLEYNAQLAQRCSERDVAFLDVTSGLIDASTGLVASHNLNRDPLDHHLDDRAWSEPIIQTLTSQEHARWLAAHGSPPIRRRSGPRRA